MTRQQLSVLQNVRRSQFCAVRVEIEIYKIYKIVGIRVAFNIEKNYTVTLEIALITKLNQLTRA
jgi:hypothetical protein